MSDLPFTSLSADTEQEFFADGLTEDLITELSKAPGLFVIARHSCFAFKNKSVDVRQVAKDLGVRYILEGSARRAAARIRINAQLIDAREGGGHLWAERFDRNLADVFAVQDEVVARIVEALVGKLAASKLPDRKPPKSLEAYDLFVRGRFLYQRSMMEEGKEARRLFEQAFAIDLVFAAAGYCLTLRLIDSHIRSSDPTLLGWAVTLACYQPFWGFVYGRYLSYQDELSWGAWLAGMPAIQMLWGSAIIALLAIYVVNSDVWLPLFELDTSRHPHEWAVPLDEASILSGEEPRMVACLGAVRRECRLK